MAGNASRINGKKGGRPCGFETSETKTRRAMKQQWLEKVRTAADRIFDAQLDLALGHFAQVNGPEGPVRVYKRSPDGRSLQWIMEHVWGKAHESMSLQNEPELNEEIPEETMRDIRRAINLGLPAEHCNRQENNTHTINP